MCIIRGEIRYTEMHLYTVMYVIFYVMNLYFILGSSWKWQKFSEDLFWNLDTELLKNISYINSLPSLQKHFTVTIQSFGTDRSGPTVRQRSGAVWPRSTLFTILANSWDYGTFRPRKLILQMRMHSDPVGLDIWFLVRPFVFFNTLCVRIAKALVRLCRCTGSPEPALVAFVIRTIISCTGSFDLHLLITSLYDNTTLYKL